MENINIVLEKVKPVFDAVATKIGEGSEFVWTVLIKQQFVDGVTDLIVAGVMLVIFIACLTILVKSAKKTDGDDIYMGGIALGIMGMIFTSLIGLISLTEGIKHVINPEYYALQFLMDLVK